MGEVEQFFVTMLMTICLTAFVGMMLDIFAPSEDMIKDRAREKANKKKKKNEIRRAKKSK